MSLLKPAHIWLLLTLMGTVNSAFALSAPNIKVTAAGSALVRITIVSSEPVDGFNVYFNSVYSSTHRPARDVDSFTFAGKPGDYCVVGFKRINGVQQFSPCSAQVQLRSASPLPPAPGNLRGTLYSSTAAEIFWDTSFDNVGVKHFEVTRNGIQVAQLDGRSYFDSTLSAGSGYRYEVVAIDFAGNRSAASSVQIGSFEPDNVQIGRSESDYNSNSFSISIPGERYTLTEGDSTGVFIPVSINRHDNHQRAVNLSLRAQNSLDKKALSYQFEPANLPADKSGSVLNVKLGVAMAPLSFHERRFILSVSDGVGVQEQLVIFDVKPVKAPDIYLLAGQSNMEGSSELFAKNSQPGGADELNVRIRQLNVQPGSLNVFKAPWQFSDEATNISSPRYIIAEDPLHEPRAPGQPAKQASFIGPGLSFAKAALPFTTQEIYLVPAAWSATGFCASEFGDVAWNATPNIASHLGGSLLTKRALTRLNMTLRDTGGIFRGIIWHQGEADSNRTECAYDYRQNLAALVSRLRTEALPDARGHAARGPAAAIPLVVGSMSRGNDSRGRFSDFGTLKQFVDTVHRTVSDTIPFAGFSNHDDLVPPAFRCGRGSCVHFGAAAYSEMGHLYLAALRRIISR